ncbi:MAG: ZIP family metal transporter [Acidobacteriota bacterium]
MYTITSVMIVSLISLIGVFTLSFNKSRLEKITQSLVSFAVGGLFGDAIIHLLPESFERMGINLNTSIYVLVGILIFFVLEKIIRWQHCHIPTSEDHLHPVGAMNLMGDVIHNLFDGLVIGVSYLSGTSIGIATTIAVILHEIPQEIGDFGVLVHSGLSVGRALFFNFLSALVAVLGAVISLLVGPYIANYAVILLPLTAGGFLYIAGSDLIPELQHDIKLSRSISQLLFIVFGIGIMVLLAVLE